MTGGESVRIGDSARGLPLARVTAMEARRQAILLTAETLIRREQSTSFSMRRLAADAGVSTATTYNLIGSKATVLYSILIEKMEEIFLIRDTGEQRHSPLDILMSHADVALSLFIENKGLLKPLFQHLLGLPDKDHHHKFMSLVYNYWLDTTDAVSREAALRPPLRLSDVSRHLQIFSIGVLELWVHEELDELQFKEEIQHGLAGLAAAFWELDDLASVKAVLARNELGPCASS